MSFGLDLAFTLGVSNGNTESPFDVNPSGFRIQEGKAFTLGGFGDLTGVTDVQFNGVSSTSIVVTADGLSLTAIAPANGVRFDEEIPVEVIF